MSDDLKPCPFCGGTTIDDVEFDGDVPICATCGAEGPAWPRDGDARALWNKRPGEEALQAEAVMLREARNAWTVRAQEARAEVERLTGLLAPRKGMTFDEAKEHVSDRWGDVLRRLGE